MAAQSAVHGTRVVCVLIAGVRLGGRGPCDAVFGVHHTLSPVRRYTGPGS